MDGTWRAKICDLIYMMSQQPIDVFNLKESQGELYNKPVDRGDYYAYGGMYHLRDLRKKGLTEEFLSQGENDKGGHETEAMRNHYRLIKPPKRARTTIRFGRERKVSK